MSQLISKVKPPIIWDENKLQLIDQRVIPAEENYLDIKTLEQCYEGINQMVVRGAPCIGFTAIFGMALWLNQITDDALNEASIDKACDYLIAARPTAVNLEFEVNRCREKMKSQLATKSRQDICADIVSFGEQQMQEAHDINLTMAKYAADELSEIYGPDSKLKILTHCNTGTLACGTLGTALGVICYLNNLGRIDTVYADETRPYLQGSRLTSYELKCEGINHRVVVEGAASYMMSNQMIDAIFVGADRIASNRDSANKVGTCNLAIIAKRYKVPFYVVAPMSSIDLSIKTGKEIEVEQRPQEEILNYKDYRIAPEGVEAFNPSFDVTPSELITGVICEQGVFRHKENLMDHLK